MACQTVCNVVSHRVSGRESYLITVSQQKQMLVCSGRPLPGCICMCKEMFSDAPCIHLSSRPGVIAGIREASFMISMAHAEHREEFYAAAGGGIARQAGCVPQPDPQVGSTRVRTKPPCRPRLDARLVVHIGFSPHLGSACRPSFRVPVKTCSSVARMCCFHHSMPWVHLKHCKFCPLAERDRRSSRTRSGSRCVLLTTSACHAWMPLVREQHLVSKLRSA